MLNNNFQRFLVVTTGAVLCLAAIQTNPVQAASFTTLFFEDFESNLSEWTGKYNSTHYGAIVNDPLEKDKALSFTSLKSGGDIFSRQSFISPSQTYRLSFDYLGLPKPWSRSNDLGGFLGYRTTLSGDADSWLAGTSRNSIKLSPNFLELPDTGKWEPISIAFTSSKSIQLTLEDYFYSWGVAGDVYFDNIHLEAMVPTSKSVPEPTAVFGLLTVTTFSLVSMVKKKIAFAKVSR
ncbi:MULTISPECIES: PEP-CTERM sorting domain-containing protein [Aerosakkonema]|uniref:PEP-CTERM sorting domain-containing protein n=1 Tax=Aerosakkonema TaxID=1246629 RepID=UPI0035BA1D50